MIARLDVFVRHKKPEWLGCAETLETALELVRKTGPGSYFVFSQTTEHKDYYEMNSEGVIFRNEIIDSFFDG